ncbi:MAG TPA: alpha/beta fold hydrolase [Actinophytocola sp.]|uniref:alpha/beta fold hydrolase n=1 Tax=Actinophytocola sp. TaxID=1872138 RepID=UPI002F94C5A2
MGALELYCERHGNGHPLVLLHGAFGTIESCFADLLPALARDFEVISVELQGHGRTRDVGRPLTYEAMAADLAALLDALSIPRAHFAGYSMGGAVALQVALDRPAMVGQLVWFGGASFDPGGIYPQYMAAFDSFDLHQLDGSRWHEAYRRVAPDPGAWTSLVAKVNELDRSGEPSWPRKQLAALPTPTLLINGDSDVVRPEHAVEMFRLMGADVASGPAGLPQAQLALLPGTSHEGMLNRVGWLSSMITRFLTSPQQ